MKMRKRKIMQARCKMHWYFESGFWAWLGKWIKCSKNTTKTTTNIA